MQHLSLRALLTLIALSLSACSSLLPGDPPQIQVVGLEPLPGESLEARFALALRVQNPNSRAIDYQGIAVDLQVNGQPLASGVSDQQGRIPGFAEQVIRVPVSISAFSVLRQAWGMANRQAQERLPYRLRGKLASGWLGGARFDTSGELSWPPGGPAQPAIPKSEPAPSR
ncbi:water stress/hypersensitive response domain-containing protein [Pseudomonas sp. HAR-UPW-AIA-41]|uniref:LEA type 2 family protein n=1 Tax=Pseudomonas sp. HAR-UPW-AIA-41 TaxID=1985301 RepID=UPI000BB35578|nr:LEA type 2 family protein [Pseudomonas sp. HAR-UPW-AIA-41]PAV48303.1 water stress/hypersensitive response domain-containing protein [Pseudomonas sp. HAR-UPW-AIA-41]